MNLADAWYGPRWRLCWLWPLHLLMRALVAIRRALYRWKILSSRHPGIPVIVVGNIAVGGTGKTPLVLWLVEFLQQQGWKPGIVSRGYGGKAAHYPCEVTEQSQAAAVGDEPLLLKRLSNVPVVVDPQRVCAAERLRELGCDIVISDDGLQHYAMQRDIEIAVLDAVRQLGNGWLLPAGPLRELPSRLQRVQLTVGNGAAIPSLAEHAMQLRPELCWSLTNPAAPRALASFAGATVHAVAGIGNPGRFFASLRSAGVKVQEHPFADHHAYQASDLPWQDAPILMTEKDAVKCAAFATPNMWFVRVKAELSESFSAQLASRLALLRQGVKHG
jgi:tetraacyldisaccharide 4'-kinase